MSHNIYILEDHEQMREMLGDFISLDPDLMICGASATAESALEELNGLDVDLVLVDTSLPGMSGIDFVGKAVKKWPQLKCLMHSGHGEATYIEQAMAAGARGYLRKGNPTELPKAIQQVLRGETYLRNAK